MAKYRSALPQLKSSKPFLADGGLETTLIFQQGVDLPEFAAFILLDQPGGEEILRQYFASYIRIALSRASGLVLDTPTWRANRDWGKKLGYSPTRLMELNDQAVRMLHGLRILHETPDSPMVVSGTIGPRGDGYRAESIMSVTEAHQYHQEQIVVFETAGADMVTAFTMTYVEEAIGVTRAARAAGMPVVISFTVETDGKLPSGQSLSAAISELDAHSADYPQYYMVNCAHPTHFLPTLYSRPPGFERIRGIRANASAKSHAELDDADELDSGNPLELAENYYELAHILPRLHVVGGCCGTDVRHIEAISAIFVKA